MRETESHCVPSGMSCIPTTWSSFHNLTLFHNHHRRRRRLVIVDLCYTCFTHAGSLMCHNSESSYTRPSPHSDSDNHRRSNLLLSLCHIWCKEPLRSNSQCERRTLMCSLRDVGTSSVSNNIKWLSCVQRAASSQRLCPSRVFLLLIQGSTRL